MYLLFPRPQIKIKRSGCLWGRPVREPKVTMIGVPLLRAPHTLIRMYRRGPMSRDLASLVARSILISLVYAESYPKLDGPSGAFKRDLDAIAAAPEDARQVRDRLHGTLVSTVGMFLAHAIDHIRALANDMLRDPLPIWSPLTFCRAVQESTVWMVHLLDPAIGTD